MIGRGLWKIDDYVRFGKLLDRCEEMGAVNFIYTPRKNQLIAIFLRDEFEKHKHIAFPVHERRIQVQKNLVLVYFEI